MNENSMSEDNQDIPAPPRPERKSDTASVQHGGRGGRSVQPPETGLSESADIDDPTLAVAQLRHEGGLAPSRVQELQDAVEGLQEELSKDSANQDKDRIDRLRGQLRADDVPESVKTLADSLFNDTTKDDSGEESQGDGEDIDAPEPRNAEEADALLQDQIEETKKAIDEAESQEEIDAAVDKFVKFGKGLKFLGNALWIAAVVMILAYIFTNKLVAKG